MNTPSPNGKAWSLLVWTSGVGLAAVLGLLARLPAETAAIPRYLGLFACAFCLYALASAALFRAQWQVSLPGIFLLALVFHATLVPATVMQTTDVNRYLWEGRMDLRGVNPLLQAPADERLARWRDPVWAKVNHKDTPSVYPTVSQAAFALSAAVAPNSALVWKGLNSAFDLLTVLFIAGWLKERGLPAQRCLLYAWNPLPLTEFSLNGHQDAIGIALLTGAFWMMSRPREESEDKRQAGAALLLALSVFSKGYSVLAAPFLMRIAGRRRLFLAVLAAGTVALAAPLFLGWRPGAAVGPWTGLLDYTSHWERNASLFRVLAWGCDRLRWPERAARLAAGGLFLGVWMVLARRRTPAAAEENSLAAMGAFLMLSPTVYPWYAAWTLPLAVMARRWSWLAFHGLVALDYLHPFYRSERTAVLLLEYAPFGVLWGVEQRFLWQSRGTGAA